MVQGELTIFFPSTDAEWKTCTLPFPNFQKKGYNKKKESGVLLCL